MLAVRMSVLPLTSDRAPYALNFLGVVLAALLAGWRSGAVAIILGPLLVWYFVVPPTHSFAMSDVSRMGALVLLVIALYQREVDRGVAERERRLALLDDALKEIDHRTRNNYQTVLALVNLQARRASDEAVRDAVGQVADRIQAIANASQQLAVNSGNLDAVRLDDHLCALVGQIGRGLSRHEISVECDVDDVTASADTATSISIIVNELVTNALKHAFNGEGSGKVSVVGRHGSAFELIVADDGNGIDGARKGGEGGLGSQLVESFARQLGARHQVTSSASGTTHRLVIPRLH
jgi:two-component sensor histidine kinase